MNYVEFDNPITKEVPGKGEFEIFGGYYENGKARTLMARREKHGITVYEELTPVEVGAL